MINDWEEKALKASEVRGNDTRIKEALQAIVKTNVHVSSFGSFRISCLPDQLNTIETALRDKNITFMVGEPEEGKSQLFVYPEDNPELTRTTTATTTTPARAMR